MRIEQATRRTIYDKMSILERFKIVDCRYDVIGIR